MTPFLIGSVLLCAAFYRTCFWFLLVWIEDPRYFFVPWTMLAFSIVAFYYAVTLRPTKKNRYSNITLFLIAAILFVMGYFFSLPSFKAWSMLLAILMLGQCFLEWREYHFVRVFILGWMSCVPWPYTENISLALQQLTLQHVVFILRKLHLYIELKSNVLIFRNNQILEIPLTNSGLEWLLLAIPAGFLLHYLFKLPESSRWKTLCLAVLSTYAAHLIKLASQAIWIAEKKIL